MDSKYVQLVMLLFVAATLFVVSDANRNLTNAPQNWNPGFNSSSGWSWNSPNSPQNYSSPPGFNFTAGWPWKDWAIKNGPFYLNDTLVFKYDPPSNTTYPHSVYQLRNYRSFMNCDLRKAKRLASVTQGAGIGFELVLKNKKPYYLSCGEHNGIHCKDGLMKFLVIPLIRWGY
ncbi:Phytocyanin domain-containing protein [Heracleum sosnowskyi]|uniref:Phytocyanin domain-containing protein n=1 Tax=Heracleum sosnowskyi TaxID=360622 RepID=A0AAD8M4B0_9APIA|nr:Phytocyanin domain-containing protein [Heracleum sosnowskyi]KAK1358806.1 Phytocyanin domain-containing protein [Heracleum sosnowskyi]